MDTLLRAKTAKAIIRAFLLAILASCAANLSRAWPARNGEFDDLPGKPTQERAPEQGEHESYLIPLPDGEFVLALGRIFTEEDKQLLAVTPYIKVIHGGLPGTAGYVFISYF